jgi:hypothetical protein
MQSPLLSGCIPQGRAECEAPWWGHAVSGYGAPRHDPARLVCCRMRVRPPLKRRDED